MNLFRTAIKASPFKPIAAIAIINDIKIEYLVTKPIIYGNS
jgi:hypothetical protein